MINKPAPPMLLIVDARREGLRKGVNVTLQSNTYSWTPLVFDDRAGATSCDVAGGFGPHLSRGLSLLPGEVPSPPISPSRSHRAPLSHRACTASH